MEQLTAIGQIGFLGNTVLRWGVAALIALAVMLLLLFGRRLVRSRYQRMRSTDRVELLEVPFSIVQRTAFLFIFVVAVAAGLATLELDDTRRTAVATAAIIAFCWQMGLWLSAALVAWLEHRRMHVLAENRAAAGSLDIIAFIGRMVIWAVVLLLTLDNLGINITTLIAGLGIGGIAIALAAQNILGDLFASLSITFDKPFIIGDFLVVGDVMGTVETIGIKSTRLRSLTGEQIVMSNADLLSSRVRNFQRMRERRIVFTLGITYETPRERLQRIPDLVRKIIEAQSQVRFERCHFAKFGPSSLDFETVYFVLTADFNRYMDIQQAVNFAIHAAFEQEQIDFAYPTQRLLMPVAPAATVIG